MAGKKIQIYVEIGMSGLNLPSLAGTFGVEAGKQRWSRG
jgi:hypothetical protein